MNPTPKPLEIIAGGGLILGILVIGIIVGAVLFNGEDADTPTAQPTPTLQAITSTSTLAPTSNLEPTPEPAPTEEPRATPAPVSDRCVPAPPELIQQIEWGLTADGITSFQNVYVVDNNDNRPWRFIGGAIHAPGMDGEVAVWATPSLDLDTGDALLTAADTMAFEFSVWMFPNGNDRFASQFDDEIAIAEECAKG